MNDRITIPPREPKRIMGRKPEFNFRTIKPGEVKRFECSLAIVRRKLYAFVWERKTFDTWFHDEYETTERNGDIITIVYRAKDKEDMERVKGMDGRSRYKFFTDKFEREGSPDTMENLKARYIAEGRQWPPVE